MADMVSKENRSEIMSHVTGKETKPEKIGRKYLFAQGLRYRKNVKRLSRTPDIVLQKYKAVIFVNGCFWHGHQGCNSHFYIFTLKRLFFYKRILNESHSFSKLFIGF